MFGAVLVAILSIVMGVMSGFGGSTDDLFTKAFFAVTSIFYTLLQSLALFAVGAALRIGATALLSARSDDEISAILGPSLTQRAHKRAEKLAVQRDAFYHSIESE